MLGHEMGGVIAAGPREGMRVVIEPANPCGHCAACRAGDANLCPSVKFCGHAPIDGALRTYMAWPQRLLLSIPDSIANDDCRSWSRWVSPSMPWTSAMSGPA